MSGVFEQKHTCCSIWCVWAILCWIMHL